jgi:hypothetical protein
MRSAPATSPKSKNEGLNVGYSLAWLAIKGKAPEAIRDGLGLYRTGAQQPFPEPNVTAATLLNGWYLIVADDVHVASDAVLEAMTRECEAVTCFVEEHTMLSTAAGWRNGNLIWAVTHNSQHGIDHLEIQGELPSGFASIRDEQFSKQHAAGWVKPGVDYIFEIPVELAASLTGFKHDDPASHDLGDQAFEVLQRSDEGSNKKSWLSRLFRGKSLNSLLW